MPEAIPNAVWGMTDGVLRRIDYVKSVVADVTEEALKPVIGRT